MQTLTGATTIALTPENMEEEFLQCKEPVLLDFWADWCASCKAMLPSLEKLAREFEGRLKIATVDVASHPGLAAQFEVRSLPTLLLFKEGQFMGHLRKFDTTLSLQEQLDEYLG